MAGQVGRCIPWEIVYNVGLIEDGYLEKISQVSSIIGLNSGSWLGGRLCTRELGSFYH